MSQKNNQQTIKTIANIITVNLLGISTKLGKDLEKLLDKKDIVELAKLFNESKINNQGIAKAVEIKAEGSDKSLSQILEENNLLQVTDTASLEPIADQVIANCTAQVEQYKAGKTQIIGFLVGQCMKESKGKGNPKIFNELLTQKLT